MRTSLTPRSVIASIAIATVVVLNGTHAKDIATVAVPALWSEAKKQADETGQHTVKAVGELHNHVDKAKVQHGTGDGHQADTRSLRLLHHKKAALLHNRLSDRLRLWWQLTSLQLS